MVNKTDLPTSYPCDGSENSDGSGSSDGSDRSNSSDSGDHKISKKRSHEKEKLTKNIVKLNNHLVI